jgi:hypothetical protein
MRISATHGHTNPTGLVISREFPAVLYAGESYAGQRRFRIIARLGGGSGDSGE